MLAQIGEYLQMQKVQFKPRAYEKAANTIADMQESVSDMYAKEGAAVLLRIPGVGAGIAEKIEELLKTGKVKEYEHLHKKTPVELSQLSRIEGLGPSSIMKLYSALKIRNLADLEKAARQGKIKNVEGFGEKAQERILKGIEFLNSSGKRYVLGFTLPTIHALVRRLANVEGVRKMEVAGSVRRYKETIGDLDMLAVADDPEKLMKAFVSMPEVTHVYAQGKAKSLVRLRSGMDADLRVVPEKSWGAAMLYFSGSKEHNIALREIAIADGMKLNEYGLFKGSRSKEVMVAGKTEEDVYKALGLAYIVPELRESADVIEAARHGRLPNVIEYKDIKGDLQVQTEWGDGKASIEKMAQAALDYGLEYIAITDHTKSLTIANGLDEKRLLQQLKEIDKVNKKLAGEITVLKGTECDILKDGSLDMPDSILKQLDIVGVSVHSYFKLPKEEQTARIIKAMRNPYVDILFHPTGRLLDRRPPYEVDMEVLIKTAKETGVIVEIDGSPDRLDIKDEYVRRCVEAGVKMVVDSDAHAPSQYRFLEYGIATARRGWATKKDIINAWPLEKMRGFLRK